MNARYFVQISNKMRTGRDRNDPTSYTDWFAIKQAGVEDAIEFHKLPHQNNRSDTATLRELGWELVGGLEYIAGLNETRGEVRRIPSDTCSACGKEDCENEVCGTEKPLAREPVWQAADFGAFAVGDRIRFLTADNGYGGSGNYVSRTGTVTAVTARTLRVQCDNNRIGNRAVLRRADWHARDPQRDTATH